MHRKLLLLIIAYLFCNPVSSQGTEDDCTKAISNGNYYLGRFQLTQAREQFHKAVLTAKKLNNDFLYAEALLGAGQAIWYGSNFKNAADTVKLALQYFENLGDMSSAVGVLRILSNIYDDMGDYENAFKAVQDALEVLAKTNYRDDQNQLLSFVQMGRLYKNIGDYDAAMDYYTRALKMKPFKGGYPYRELNHCIGELYVARNMLDSANYFYQNAFIGNPNSKVIRLRMGELYLLKNKPDSAFPYFDSLYKETKAIGDIDIMTGTMIGLAKIDKWKGNYTRALKLTQEAFEIANQRGIIELKQDASELLASLYEVQGNTGQALYYQKFHEKLKDSTVSDVFRGQLYSFKQSKQAAALTSLENEKRLAQRTILIVCLLGVLALSIIIFRHKNEKLHLKQKAAELEMQALRAQMNPHFIFNCLSAINHFILDKDTEKASDYLTRFSRLIRMVLLNAGKSSISLEEELTILRLYLDMEQLRFKDAFDYVIDLDSKVQSSMINVPSFILQPFCENAIWHGLLHKEGKGRLDIHLKIEKGYLVCSIRDNGIGIEKAARLKMQSTDKSHSLGQKLSAARLSLFNHGNSAGNNFRIQDMKDEQGNTTGTMVVLKINIKKRA